MTTDEQLKMLREHAEQIASLDRCRCRACADDLSRARATIAALDELALLRTRAQAVVDAKSALLALQERVDVLLTFEDHNAAVERFNAAWTALLASVDALGAARTAAPQGGGGE